MPNSTEHVRCDAAASHPAGVLTSLKVEAQIFSDPVLRVSSLAIVLWILPEG